MTRSRYRAIIGALLLAIAVLAPPVVAQTALDGAWEVTQAKSGDFVSSQPGLYIFHAGYYSVLHVWGEEPRPLYSEGEDRGNVDYEKLMSIVGPVEGNSGRYATDGSTLIMTPTVAISPNFMSGPSRTYTFRLTEDQLFLEGGAIEGIWEVADRALTLRRLE